MPHQTNGKHRPTEVESPSRFEVRAQEGGDSGWLSQIESQMAQAHEAALKKTSEFVRQRPGASLLIAVAVGGVIGWLIKRRA